MDTKLPVMKLAGTGSPSSNESSQNSANSPSPQAQNQTRAKRILIIDSEPARRKERVNALKQRGFAVYPALKLEEARSRCKRGGYDLIIVSAAANAEGALQLCDEIGKGTTRQPVLLMTPNGTATGEHNHPVVSDDPKTLADRVEALLSSRASANPVAA